MAIGSVGFNQDGLPVAQFNEKIVSSVLVNEVTLISGETGSGKSTQIPQFLYAARHRFKRTRELSDKNFKICVTQPRRVAATTLARRVAEEMGESKVGGLVGYRVRFDQAASKWTSICFLTDGMLVREAVLDKGMFEQYSIVILDEVHERSLHTDILLGLLSQAIVKRRESRTPLKVVIMSATMSVGSFEKFFAAAQVRTNSVAIPGRTFPVSILYTQEVEHDYVEASVCAIFQINEEERSNGDILVFLPGQDDIEAVSSSLVARKSSKQRELVVVHLYAALTSEKQAAAFAPVKAHSQRKVILATNIAETSLTIPGVRFVIDCGLVKMKSMINAQLEVLRIVPASKATVTQRTGRAGREAPGKCFRLYRESDFDKLAEETPAEITRCELASVLLQVAAMGLVGKGCMYSSIAKFPFIDRPADSAIVRAELVLRRLGAVEANSTVTPFGRQLAAFPLHPLLANLVLVSNQFGCLHEATILAGLLSVDNLHSKGSAGNRHGGDHWALVNVFKQLSGASLEEERVRLGKQFGVNLAAFGKAVKIVSQIRKLANVAGAENPSQEQFAKCLARALWLNCAKLVKKHGAVGQYETLEKIECYIHPGSAAFGLKDPPECVVYTEIVQTSRNYMRTVSPIEGEWLTELVPMYFKQIVGK